MSVVLHIPCRSAQAYGDAKDSNLGEPGKDINICLKSCLKTFVMLHIPKALGDASGEKTKRLQV